MRKTYRKFSKGMYYGTFIRLITETMLELCICAFIDISVMNYSTPGYIASSILSWLSIIAVVGYGIWFRVFIRKNRDKLADEEFNRKFGEAYLGVKTDQNLKHALSPASDFETKKEPPSMAWSELYIWRRVVFAFTAIFLQLWLQLTILFICTIGSTALMLGSSPFCSFFDTKLEVFNDVCILILLYHVVCFTEFLPKPRDKSVMGWSAAFFTLFMIGINVLILVIRLLFHSYRGIKLHWQKWQQQKAFKKRFNTFYSRYHS